MVRWSPGRRGAGSLAGLMLALSIGSSGSQAGDGSLDLGSLDQVSSGSRPGSAGSAGPGSVEAGSIEGSLPGGFVDAGSVEGSLAPIGSTAGSAAGSLPVVLIGGSVVAIPMIQQSIVGLGLALAPLPGLPTSPVPVLAEALVAPGPAEPNGRGGEPAEQGALG